jgi:hypothetical protein
VCIFCDILSNRKDILLLFVKLLLLYVRGLQTIIDDRALLAKITCDMVLGFDVSKVDAARGTRCPPNWQLLKGLNIVQDLCEIRGLDVSPL